MIKDILRLKHLDDLSHERIAAALSISKGVVAKYLGLATAAGLRWEHARELDEADSNAGCSGATLAPIPWWRRTSPACTPNCAARA